MYEILFINYYNHLYNLKNILLILNNFKDKIINFIYQYNFIFPFLALYVGISCICINFESLKILDNILVKTVKNI